MQAPANISTPSIAFKSKDFCRSVRAQKKGRPERTDLKARAGVPLGAQALIFRAEHNEAHHDTATLQ
jgi:hypothetical protein